MNSPEVKDVLRVIDHGINVFGNFTTFRMWMESNNIDFNNKPPMEFIKNINDLEYLDNQLTKIEHGINA